VKFLLAYSAASGAVTRLKVCANLQVLRPSERQWKPRLRQAFARYLQAANSAAGQDRKRLKFDR
jgi:hypothetical protein